MTPERMAALHRRCFILPPPWRAPDFAGLMADPRAFVLTAGDAFLVGRTAADEAELLTLAVAPEARRRGHGRALVQRFEAEAARRGATRAFLEVAADNAAALALYLGAGWTRAGLRKGYYVVPGARPVDAVILRRDPATA